MAGVGSIDMGWGWDMLLRAWQGFDIPEGWRSEIREGGITMTPPRTRSHGVIAEVTLRALLSAVPRDWGVCQLLGVAVLCMEVLYMPDLAVTPAAALAEGSDDDPVSGDRLKLVVEIVPSGNAPYDRMSRRWAYAHAPVPLYLLIDRFDEHGPAVTLFSDPMGGDYRHSERVPFGEPIVIPAPFDLQLETAEFPMPPRQASSA